MDSLALGVRFEKGNGLAKVRERMPQALAYGLNNGGRKVFTAVRRGLWAQTGVKKYASITSRTANMPASPGNLTFTIVARGKPIPIREFPVKRMARGVQASPWATARVFARSFQEKQAGGGYIPGVFMARRNKDRGSVRMLYGPNLAKQMLGLTRDDQTIPQLFMSSAAAEVPQQLLKAMSKAMGI